MTTPDAPTLASALYDIRAANVADVPLIFELIRELAEFERLAHEVVGTEALLREHLFGDRPTAEVLLGFVRETGEAAGMALFFPNFSTFLTRPGIYLEDLYVARRTAAAGLGKHCCGGLPGWRSHANADDSNGLSSTGTKMPSVFTGSWARVCWTIGASAG